MQKQEEYNSPNAPHNTLSMRILIEHPQDNPIDLLRRLGYAFQKRGGDEIAFVRPLARSGFPRFHVYAKTENRSIILNIHLDQHRETYGKDTMHHGEYGDDGALGEEVARIKSTLGIA